MASGLYEPVKNLMVEAFVLHHMASGIFWRSGEELVVGAKFASAHGFRRNIGPVKNLMVLPHGFRHICVR